MSASKKVGMTSFVKATGVRFDDDNMWVELSDGRTLGVPLAWFPRLFHWEALDEDILIAGLLAGQGDQTRRFPKAAE